MSTVRAIYDGSAFIPMESFDMPKGRTVYLTITQGETLNSEIAEKLSVFNRITDNLRELNETNPLPPEFDEIVSSQRINFSRELDL